MVNSSHEESDKAQEVKAGSSGEETRSLQRGSKESVGSGKEKEIVISPDILRGISELFWEFSLDDCSPDEYAQRVVSLLHQQSLKR